LAGVGSGVSGLVLLCADDERPALEDLARLLRASDVVAEVEAVDGAAEALSALARRPFDALFLDVRMPGMDGVELARVIGRFATPPAVVFVSAYETAAVDAFELGAVDYLVKPVSRRRLDDALARVAAMRAPAVAEEEDDDLVPVPTSRGGTRLIARSSILYVQAYGDYVRIHCDDGRFLLRDALADVEERWAQFGFTRVHRGYLANLRRATEVRPRENGTAVLLLEDGSEVPIARRQVTELRRRLRGRS
jgi:DNA-binding LytR/AlgR family response regulator